MTKGDLTFGGFFTKRRLLFGNVLLVAVIAALAALAAHHLFSPSGLYRQDYEGGIVEKSLAGRESRYGSKYTYRLLIEGATGERFEVIVGEELYNRAEVGMRIRSGRKAGAEVFWPGGMRGPAQAASQG